MGKYTTASSTNNVVHQVTKFYYEITEFCPEIFFLNHEKSPSLIMKSQIMIMKSPNLVMKYSNTNMTLKCFVILSQILVIKSPIFT